MQKETTGATISRLGALTVLSTGWLAGGKPSNTDKLRWETERDAILAGERGVPEAKVQRRSIERCIVGGALTCINGVGIWGTN